MVGGLNRLRDKETMIDLLGISIKPVMTLSKAFKAIGSVV
jgi:hypothetical protein